MITSTANPQLKNVIQLNRKGKARKEQGIFCAEGRKMFLEAPAGKIVKVYLTEDALSDGQVKEKLTKEELDFETVSEPVFRRMSDTQSPQGILALVKTSGYRAEDLLSGPGEPFVLILEELQDPGNLGTIFRTAEGAGVTGIFLTEGCVDVTNPKVIRSTMGSIYRIPYLYMESVHNVKAFLKERGVRIYAAHLSGKSSYEKESYRKGTAFLIGNEARGLSEEAAALADSLIRIPMEGKVESLNAAMAAGILMYEAYRQRREG